MANTEKVVEDEFHNESNHRLRPGVTIGGSGNGRFLDPWKQLNIWYGMILDNTWKHPFVMAARKHLIAIRSAKSKLLFCKLTTVFLFLAIGTFLVLSRYPCIYMCPWTRRYSRPEDIPDRTWEERIDYVRQHIHHRRTYRPVKSHDDTYDIEDCPLHPPNDYPREYPILEVLTGWPTTDTTYQPNRQIHQGLCIFDFAKANNNKSNLRQQILNYRAAEVPFVIRNDPAVLKSVERWNTGRYLHWKLQDRVFRGEYSKSKSMLYWKITSAHAVPRDFVPPTRIGPITFEQWYERALLTTHDDSQPNNHSTMTLARYGEYAYMRMDACLPQQRRCDAPHRHKFVLPRQYFWTQLSDANFMFDDLPFFNPKYPELSELYLVEPDKQGGINCRFGAEGFTAEDHFDNERNSIAMLRGERRYILGHPANCPNMTLYPQRHPLERHSQVNWTDPDLDQFPLFSSVHVNEVVLQAGDVLYLPTYWFHHIVSLNLNIQCNIRSGYSLEYDEIIDECGFLYKFPSY